ncbi:hypothetical protein FB451DRAFT_1422837 [Mycena latifolia]|nr:hypothetical protein FB451DRAFT_1422837 [Mycena latifolia]
MASFNISGSRLGRRNMNASVTYNLSSDDLTMDRGIYASADGRCFVREAINFTAKRQRVKPSELQDIYSNWVPMPDSGDGLGVDDGRGEDYEDDDEVDPVTGAKQKRYRSSDDPNGVWWELKQMFLDETLRSEGLGDSLGDVSHALHHLHALKEWTGEFWEDVTLHSLNLVYQLGHGGLPCPTPAPPERTMVVVHTNGVHTALFVMRVRHV